MVDRIRTLLESRQLTPTQFADLIGVARPIISHILSGRNKPSLDVVQRILAALPNLSMAWLLNGTEPMLTTVQPAATPEGNMPPAVSVVSVAPNSSNPTPVVSQTVVASEPAAAEKTAAGTTIMPQEADRKAVVNGMVGHAKPRAFVAPTPRESVPASLVARGATRLPEMRRFSIKRFSADQPEGAQIGTAPVPQAGAPLTPETNNGSNTIAAPNSAVSEGEPDAQPFTAPTAFVTPVAAATPEAGPVPSSSAEPVPPAAISAPSQSPTLANDVATALFTGAEKPIRRIVIFYRDGSFADYQPE